jgi:hypothetical protein
MTSRRNGTALLGGLASLAVLACEMPAHASEIAFGVHDIQTTFFISKSDDKNRVDYGMRLDTNCAPVGDDAVFPYWRIFEKAPPVRTQSLSFMDKIPYGISTQRTLVRGAMGGEYTLRLKQFERPIRITTTKGANGACSAVARATINGTEAQLISVFAKLAGLVSVDYIDVFGKNLKSGVDVTERIRK